MNDIRSCIFFVGVVVVSRKLPTQSEQYNIISKATYTMYLRAEYGPKETPTPTYIWWYKNYEDNTPIVKTNTVITYNDQGQPVETANVKYVFGYGSFASEKCHHSVAMGLNPLLTIASRRIIRFLYCSSVIPL